MLQELQLESEIRALEMEVDIQKWPTFNIPKMDQVMNSRFFFFLNCPFRKELTILDVLCEFCGQLGHASECKTRSTSKWIPVVLPQMAILDMKRQIEVQVPLPSQLCLLGWQRLQREEEHLQNWEQMLAKNKVWSLKFWKFLKASFICPHLFFLPNIC